MSKQNRLLERLSHINFGAWAVLHFKSVVKGQIEVRYQNGSCQFPTRGSYGIRRLFSGYFIRRGPVNEHAFAFLLDEGLIRFTETKRGVDIYVVRHDWRKQLERYFANVDADNARQEAQQDAVIAALEASEASENSNA